MSDKDALVDSIISGYEFRLREQEQENDNFKRQLAEARAEINRLREKLGWVPATFDIEALRCTRERVCEKCGKPIYYDNGAATFNCLCGTSAWIWREAGNDAAR